MAIVDEITTRTQKIFKYLFNASEARLFKEDENDVLYECVTARIPLLERKLLNIKLQACEGGTMNAIY